MPKIQENAFRTKKSESSPLRSSVLALVEKKMFAVYLARVKKREYFVIENLSVLKAQSVNTNHHNNKQATFVE